jgi:glc operon protein GlcG
MRKINIFVFSLLIAAATLDAQQLSTKKSLNLAVTKVIVAAAEKEATKNGWAMFIAVIDDGGVLTTVERMDDAQIGSLDVAIGKAQTSLKFKRPSKAFEDLINSGRNSLLALPGVTPVEGGFPLMADGKVIGAIGVSGGSSQQDAQVAQAGVAALEALLKAGK